MSNIQEHITKAGHDIASIEEELRMAYKKATPLELLYVMTLHKQAIDLRNGLICFNNAIGD